MNLPALGALLAESPFFPPGPARVGAALAAVPEVVGLSGVEVGGGGRVSIPVAPAGALEAAVTAAVHARVEAALAGETPAEEPANLAGDPLVVAVEAALRAARGEAAVGEVALRIVRASASAVSGVTGQGALAGHADATAVVARAVTGLQARLVAAAGETGARGVLGQVIASRLALAIPAGGLDLGPGLARAAALVGSPLPPAVLAALPEALAATVGAILARRAAGKSTPEDDAFLVRYGGIAPADRLGAAVAIEPDAVAALGSGLARFADVATLTAAGAEALAVPGAGLAAAAAWGELLDALRRWEVLAGFAAALSPVGGVAGALRGDGGGVGSVVAVGMGRVREGAGDAAARVEAVWAAAVAKAGAAIVADHGAVAWLVFDDPLVALRFVVRLPARFAELGVRPAVGVAHGRIEGWVDGTLVALFGPAVEAAGRWLARAPLEHRRGVRHLGVVRGVLCGDGIGLADGFRDAVQGAGLRARCAVGELRGGTEIGLAVDLDERIVVFAGLGTLTGGWELLRLSEADWRALPAGAPRAGRTDAPRPGATPPPDAAPPAPAAAAWRFSARAEEVAPPVVPTAPAAPVESSADPVEDEAFVIEGDAADEPAGASEAGGARWEAPLVDPFLEDVITLGGGDPAPEDAGGLGEAQAGPDDGQAALVGFDATVGAVAPEVGRGARPEGAPAPWSAPPPGDPFLADAAPTRGSTAPDDPFAGLDFAFLDEAAPPPAVGVEAGHEDTEEDAPPSRPPEEPAVREGDGATPSGAVPPTWLHEGDDALAELLAEMSFPEEPPSRSSGSPERPGADDNGASDVEKRRAETGVHVRNGEPERATRASPAFERATSPASGDGGVEASEAHGSAPEGGDVFTGFSLPDLAEFPDLLFAEPPPAPDPATPAGPPPPGPAPAASPPVANRAPPRRSGVMLHAAQVAPLFASYVTAAAGGRIHFGQPYESRLVDWHAYPADVSLDDVYRSFVLDKIQEGFVLRTDLLGELPSGAPLHPLDAERLARVLGEL